MAEAIETAIYKMGVQEADYVRGMRAASAADAEKIKSSEQVSQSEEKVDKSFRTTTQGLERRLGRMSEAIRIEQQYAKDLAYQQRIETEGVGTAQQRAAHLELINKRYNEQTAALKNTGGATQAFGRNVGLARHELVNMSRQVQDIGVSLASGQSPFTVLVQQGTQVADIFATSTGSVRGFFGQALGFAGRFVTSIAGVATGVAALGATFIGATASFASGQKEIERSLMGIGRVSGATVDDINRIAEATATLGTISTSEARSIATSYAAVGISVREHIEPLTAVTRNFALITNQSVEEAAQAMAKAFATPLSGADQLNKVLGFLNDRTREQIRLAERAGDVDAARSVLLQSIIPSLQNANDLVSQHGSLWTAVANFISNAWTELGKFGSRLTGIGQSRGDEMAGIEEDINRILERISRLRRNRGASEEQEEQLRRLTERYGELADAQTKAAEAAEQAKFDQKAIEIGNLVRATIPGITAVSDLEAEIRKLDAALAEPRIMSGLGVSEADVRRASTALQEQKAVIEDLRRSYGNVSIDTAKTLRNQEAQLRVAQATTTQARLDAQMQAQITQLVSRQVPLHEAIRRAVNDRSIAQATIINNANQELKTLQQQYELLRASSEEERNRIEAAQTYQRILNNTNDSSLASAVASQQLANAQEQARQAAEGTATAAERSVAAYRESAEAARQAVEASNAAFAAQQKFLEWKWQNIFNPPTINTLTGEPGGGPSTKVWVGHDGKMRNFDPAGYESSFPMLIPASVGQAGFGNFTTTMANDVSVSQQGLTNITDDILKRGGSIMDAINKTIGIGPITQDHSSFLQQLTELIPEEQQIGVIEKQLEKLREEPVTLAREQLIHQLNESLEQLKESTDGLKESMEISLDPLFSQGHDALKIGYYKAANGLDGIVQGSGGVDSVPVHVMATPGERVSFTPPGRDMQPGNRTTVINQTINFPQTAMGERRRSARQLAEGFSRGLSAIH